MTTRLSIDDHPTKTRRRFTALQKQDAANFCLQKGLSCAAVTHRLGLPSSSLASWVRQARIDRDSPVPRDQGLITTGERYELNRLRKENRELRTEEFFQAGGSALCKRAAFAKRFCLIHDLVDRFSVCWLCRQLGVARSGYYAWRQETLGKRAALNAVITTEIQAVFEQHRGFYGYPRVQTLPMTHSSAPELCRC